MSIIYRNLMNTCGIEVSGKNVDDILNKSGLDFEVALAHHSTDPVKVSNSPTPKSIRSTIGRTSYRTDLGLELGQVGNTYTVIQNKSIFSFIQSAKLFMDKF